MEWKPVKDAPSKKLLILYFPSRVNRRGQVELAPMYKVDYYPVFIPRKPTHFMPLPAPPQDRKSGE